MPQLNAAGLAAVTTGFRKLFTMGANKAKAKYTHLMVQMTSTGSSTKVLVGGGLPGLRKWVGERHVKSLKLFAQSFEHYCELVDEAVLFDNNVFVDLEKGELPPTAAKKDAKDSPLEILDEASFQSFMKHRNLNPRATKLDDLYESASTEATTKTK